MELRSPRKALSLLLSATAACASAAAMAARLPVPDVRAIDVAALRAALRAHGAYLP